MTERPLPKTLLRERRDRTVELLCEHFANDRLELADLERRLDQAHGASTIEELDALVQDLPAPAAAQSAEAETPARDALARRTRGVAEAIRTSRTMLAFMGGFERRGHWSPARKNIVIAVWGGAGLDFREVELPPGETEVFVFCIMGGAEVIVPPDLAVDASGIAIMGGFEQASAPRRTSPDAPVLRIHGVCIMGGVDIQVRHPGESAKDARRRQREEAKLLRDQHRRRLTGEE